MANYPKKMKDPTEAALSAIQEALNLQQEEEQAASQPEGMADLLSGPAEGRAPSAPAAACERRSVQFRCGRHPRSRRPRGARRQRRSAIDRPDPARAAAPAGPLVLFRRHRVFRRLDCRLSVAVVRLSVGYQCRAWTRPLAGCADDRAWRRGAVADHFLLRRRPYGLARPGVAPDRPIDGAGRHAARRARERSAGFHRHRRPGHPSRGRRHGRRRRAGAGAGERARSSGAERGCGARTHLQRQRSTDARAAAGSRQPARHAGRPGRAGPLRDQQRPHRSDAGSCPRSATWSASRSTRRRNASRRRWRNAASTSR